MSTATTQKALEQETILDPEEHAHQRAALRGLSGVTAAARLQTEGDNELPSSKARSVWAIAWEVVREPMFILLLAAGGIYLVLGDLEEALLLLGFVFVIIGITLYQERKTERALEALRDLSSPRALVVRDGEQTRIPGREVVREDLIVLSEGDRVPADAMVVSAINLSTDESLLTGESVPVRKSFSEVPRPLPRPGGDDLPFVYSGTLVVQGRGSAVVLATGIRTEIGKIGKALQTVELESSLLQRETRRIVQILALIGFALCIAVAVGYGLTRGNWLTGLLGGIALAMAMLPEEFPVVLTIFLALGAWRMSQKQVLARRVPAIEMLGAATVLCVDKTGTLTQNRMSVQKVVSDDEAFEVGTDGSRTLTPALAQVAEYAVLASQSEPFDPMELAFHQFFQQQGLGNAGNGRTLLQEYPLSRELLAVTRVWCDPTAAELVVACKGAPEAVMALCHLGAAARLDVSDKVRGLAGRGLRVLAVARGSLKQATLPHDPREFRFQWLGLIALADPIRPAVPDAIRECYEAGMRVIMITGDYPVTAQSIACQIGLRESETVITGADLDAMSGPDLERRIRETNIFARVVPEQKLRIVEALKANGEIVAMTGDGVNDAPALKSAHIGIAMGARGTDVAREAAALVLLDDDFSSIVSAVRMGRRVFDNLKKAMAYIFAIHVPIAGMSLIPVLLGWPLVLLPIHIVFLELIIDPACSTAFEAEREEAGTMKRPPREPKQPLFSARMIGLAVTQGLAVLVIVIGVFAVALWRGQSEGDARALAFTTLMIGNLALIWTNRSWSRTVFATLRSTNTALWSVTIGAAFFLAIALSVPLVRGLFRFSRLHLIDVGICLVAGCASVLWFEAIKLAKKRKITANGLATVVGRRPVARA